jgi:signal transduction histidine kinase
MPSPRTEAAERPVRSARVRPRSRDPRAFLQQLNARLVLALAVVALVSLVVSGIAINQILPGYFAEQTQQRIETSVTSAAVLLQQEVTDVGNSPTGQNLVEVDELRDTQVVTRVARAAATLFNATFSIINQENVVVAEESPPDPGALEEQGLRRDPEVGPVAVRIGVELPMGRVVEYRIIASEPYSTRAETLERIQSALLGAGVLALAASLITGLIAARRVTGPIGRLRRVAGRIAQGHLDERAQASGVVEIDELAAQFNVMADRLSGTLRMLEADRDRLREFVADVSHELRTPIAALRMYNELQTEGDVDEATRREFLERSIDQIGRLEWLSTNLLDLSRIDAGIFPLDIRTGDLRDPIQAVVQAHSEVAVKRGVALDSAVPAEPVELRFDRERMVQLLTNLVGNALKFTPRGGGVSVELQEADGAVTVEVRDTGPGIPADELPHIFDRFYRGTNTGQARASGSGLGLAIVRSIVEMHRGEIDVASVVGEGTAFRITLPRAVDPTVDEAADKINETSPLTHAARNHEPVA